MGRKGASKKGNLSQFQVHKMNRQGGPWGVVKSGKRVDFYYGWSQMKLVESLYGKRPLKYYVSKEVGGWGQKAAIFADLQYYLC